MNHAAGAVTSLNPDPVKVGDVAGQRAQRRGLLQGSVRPVGVAEVFVLPQHGHEVALVPYQGPVGQFAAAAADPPFHDRVHSGRLDGGAGDPGARGAEDFIERGGEAGVPVMNHELDPRPGVRQVHEQVPGLPHDPRLDGMLRGAQDPDAAGAVLDHGKDVHRGAVEEAAVKKSRAKIPCACDRGNSAHPGPSRRGAGPVPAFLRISQTVDGATVMPSPASSPWIRR
jgi:hypothetical protein